MNAELKSKSELTRATIMLSVGMALSGTAGLFSVSTGQPTFNVVFFRCLFGAAALTGWVCLRGGWKDLFSIERKLWPLVLVSGVCLVINWLALFEAFHRTSIGFATIIYHLQPFWIVLAGGLLLREALSRHMIAWLWLAFVGLVFTILPKLGDMQTDRNWLIGVGLALVASLFYTATTLTTRAVKGGVKPDVLSTVHCLIGCIAFVPFLDVATLQGGDARMWGWLAGLGVIHTGIVYVLLYSSYPKVPTTVIAAAAFLNPAAALISDFLAFGRSITAMQGVGLGLILLAGLGVNLGWPFFFGKLRVSPRNF
ncbi:MAG: DMT family transporter [Mesorhizobium sp.]|uniref:DMT family transporter n=1 Tax=Mesorhizobium sp. TaxID=1871066 RepID=UPI000FE7840D|nr:DMT family transporter [Mesorhizobium sp.]RWI02618.1 MAG: DMT family transporter [Mesorhizobium sp.]RWK95291.1 MAG: DMT family transporter [Mesorhizobium sp.]RWL13387.1 MAG: DMT family transporter [Mesorhizobium sp.]TIP40421.1 MAG: DMT family transporter [Mesorhizobium sp.]TIP69929.1 MAG: DMT family transporter [Mesorhizobium sp.]